MRYTKLQKDVCHNLWRAQTTLIHYTRGPAEWLTLKPDTGMLSHLTLGDNGTRLQDTICPGHRCFEDLTSRQLGLSRPTPPMSATLNRAAHMNDAGSPQTSCAYHFDSRSPTHLQSPRINASQPTRSKLYSTNHREEEDPTWPFASSQAVQNSNHKKENTVWKPRILNQMADALAL